MASAALDVATVADALSMDRFAVMGHSGGGPHALACAAVLPERVLAAVCMSGLAPFGAEGLDWFADMAPSGAAELRAAAAGRAALDAHFASRSSAPAWRPWAGSESTPIRLKRRSRQAGERSSSRSEIATPRLDSSVRHS